MYGADWCSDCQRAKNFLNAHGIAFEYRNIDIDETHVATVEQINNGKRVIPTFEILGRTYTNPANQELACILGINDVGRIQLFGADWCPDCRRAKSFLDAQHVHYQFIDVDVFEWATQKVEQINNGKRIIPTILVDETPYTNPNNATLVEVLGLSFEVERKVYDVIIIGGGAAGLTTAIYTQREKLSSLILEKKNIGGNAFLTEKIENYPGFVDISGPKLMERMAEQAKVYGTDIKEGVEVTNIRKDATLFKVETVMGTFEGKTVVIATGSTYKRLNIPGENELIGAGIHFCATCDGPFYRGRNIVVIGGGNSALEEGLYLSEFTESVSFVVRKPEFSASTVYTEKLPGRTNVHAHMNQKATAFVSNDDGTFRGIQVRHNDTGEEEILEADGAFIFIGLKPNTSFLKDFIDLDERGFIQTKPGHVETSIEGVFAAGDCRQGAIAQVAAATGEGVMASYGVKAYLKQVWG